MLRLPHLSITSQLTRHVVTTRSAVFVAMLTVTSLLSACGKSTDTAAADSLLSRDLTLATTPTRPLYTPTLSDTALSDPSAAPLPRDPKNPVSAEPTPKKAVRSAVPPASPPKAPQVSPPKSPPKLPADVPVQAPVTVTQAAPSTGATSTAGADSTSARDGKGRHVFASGTTLVGRTNAEICSLANRPGDRIVAALTSEVVSPDGTRLPAGTPVLIEMSAPDANGDFAFRVKAVQVAGVLVPIEGTTTVAGETTEHKVSKGGDKGKVISGAIAGAIIGRVLGGGAKGTIIGAAGGAATGSAAAARNAVTEKCLPSGATITVTLTAPLVLAGVP